MVSDRSEKRGDEFVVNGGCEGGQSFQKENSKREKTV